MNRRRHRRDGAITAYYLGTLVLVGLAGCESLWSAPDGRAQEFIETLVTKPVDAQKLRDIALLDSGQNPEDLLDGLPARVAVDFLRAKQAQGLALDFARSDIRQVNLTRRMITVRVSYRPSGAPVNSEVRFQVQLEKNMQGRWHVARVTGDN